MFIEFKQLFHWRRTFHKGREFARCRRLIAGLMMFTAASAVVHAAPTGGIVDYGSAEITLGKDTVIDQYSRRVDIDWTGFDTAQDESVTFNQEYGSDAVAINRISGARTQFDGTLNANGQIFLINQNGITFGSTSRVNVGSLLATTADTNRLSDEEELLTAQGRDGKTYVFDNAGYASVVNEGDIIVSDGGFAVLAAPRVENRGYIKADLGQIELVSTRQFSLNVDFRGDGLITFEVPQEAFEGEEGLVLGVTNEENENGEKGILQARSGHVYLTTAKFAGEVVQGAINLSGVIDADQFVDNGNGVEMVASGYGYYAEHPGGNIVVESAGDINIGGGADIHAIGGEKVSARFEAGGDITMGAAGDPASITLRAFSDTATDNDANAEAELVMVAEHGSIDIIDGTIEVTARATARDSGYDYDNYTSGDYEYDRESRARAQATAYLQGEQVNINADITVEADAQVASADAYPLDPGTAGAVSCYDCERQGVDGAEALAVLDVFATGDYESAGDLSMTGDIKVAANARTDEPRSAVATANTVLAATGDLEVTGNIDVDAVAISGSVLDSDLKASDYGCSSYDCYDRADASVDANAALVMLGGVPRELLEPLRSLSFRDGGTDSLSDVLTLTDARDLLGRLDGFGGLEEIAAGFGDGDVTYTGDINVRSHAEFNATGTTLSRTEGQARATSAALIAGGGDVFINTDPVRVDAQAYANYDDYGYGYEGVQRLAGSYGGYYGDGDDFTGTEARSFLVMAAGLGDPVYGDYEGSQIEGGHDLTVLGDVSATARELNTLNGTPYPEPDNPLTGALTALLATGDITVRGADPLAQAGPLSDPDRTALAQGRTSMWQSCDLYGCNPVEAGTGGLDGFIQGGNNLHLAQLIIEAGGEIDIQPKPEPEPVGKVQPSGLFQDPVGPDWPGDKPLRFAADGEMLVATGADATHPPRIAALPGDIEAAILAGGDPSTLLPPTASGGCVAAGRDAYTIGNTDYFDRLVSRSCESVEQRDER